MHTRTGNNTDDLDLPATLWYCCSCPDVIYGQWAVLLHCLLACGVWLVRATVFAGSVVLAVQQLQ